MVSSPDRSGLISRARIQKLLLYPPWSGVSRFGSVSAAADWQGLDAPFIVELFMFRRLSGYPDVINIRLVSVATARLPTPACVKRTCRVLHPIGLAAVVRVPPGDWSCSLFTTHPL